MKNKIEKAFTLIELLVVIAIIGILAGILFVAINPKAQADKAKDAKRLSFVKELEKALEMYNLNHGYYPKYSSYGVNTWSDPGRNVSNFENDMKDYITMDLNKMFEHDEFWYKSASDNNFQTYNIAIMLKSESNHSREVNDGGYNTNHYEVGSDIQYCMNKYIGSDRKAVRNPEDSRCTGGN